MMKPMEAWRHMSKNMTELYRRRRDSGDPEYAGKCGYTDDDIEAEVLAFRALEIMKERQEEEND